MDGEKLLNIFATIIHVLIRAVPIALVLGLLFLLLERFAG